MMRLNRNAMYRVGILLLAVLAVAVVACSGNGNDGGDTPEPSNGTVESAIQNFTLEDLTISVGTEVVWTNSDGAPHTATSGSSPNPDGMWNTGSLSTNQSAQAVTFDETGTFQYFCTIHPSMQATVTVTN